MAGCSSTAARLVLAAPDPPCRVTTLLDAPVRWLTSSDPHAGQLNRAYCEAVGPVEIGTSGFEPAPDRGDLMIVTWNMAVGAGDLEGLLRTLEADERTAGRPVPDFVVLLQEAYRTGQAVPAAYARYARVPGRIAHGERRGRDIASLAARLGMNFVYAPSMRNGAAASDIAPEDRGNAILSTLPLRDLSIVELPFEHQRRVAVAARVMAPGMAVTVASVHLDTRRALWRGSIFAGPAARQRQAQALADALATIAAEDPVIVAGDFNTLAGPDEPAIRSLEQRFTRVGCGEAPTHRWGFQLDYVFASDAALLTGCDREDRRFGSDHHPLTARLAR